MLISAYTRLLGMLEATSKIQPSQPGLRANLTESGGNAVKLIPNLLLLQKR